MKTAPRKFTTGPYEINDAGLIYSQASGGEDEAPFVADVCDSPLEYTDQERATGQLLAASWDLLDALETLTDAAQSVIDAWETGDLAGAVRTLDASIEGARAGIDKAKSRTG